MKYVDQTLLPDEQVLHRAVLHWSVYLSSVCWLVFAVICWGISLALSDAEARQATASAAAAITLGALAFVGQAVIRRRTTELAVTSRRIIAKFGFIRRHTIELNHNKLESVQVDQSVAGRLLDFGTLILTGTGGGKTPIPRVSHPLIFRIAFGESVTEVQAGGCFRDAALLVGDRDDGGHGRRDKQRKVRS
jgi:hypothetical protein